VPDDFVDADETTNENRAAGAAMPPRALILVMMTFAVSLAALRI
jgi:hypothetical protein